MRSIVVSEEHREILTRLMDNIGYEIMPFDNVVDLVVAHVPTEIPLTVTATQARGLKKTLDTAIELKRKGYTVAPHVPARQVTSKRHLDEIVSQLEGKGIDRIFIIAGDAKVQEGEFEGALDLLKALDARGHHFTNIGISGYPEGHAFISAEEVEQALRDKYPYAHRILTQICFSADIFVGWSIRLKNEGIDLPIHAGMPGPVSRQKLMRIASKIGLGQSANFLKKQKNMFWRFFTPTGYDPTNLLKGLVQHVLIKDSTISGLHINTFNDLEATEQWRQNVIQTNELNISGTVRS